MVFSTQPLQKLTPFMVDNDCLIVILLPYSSKNCFILTFFFSVKLMGLIHTTVALQQSSSSSSPSLSLWFSDCCRWGKKYFSKVQQKTREKFHNVRLSLSLLCSAINNAQLPLNRRKIPFPVIPSKLRRSESRVTQASPWFLLCCNSCVCQGSHSAVLNIQDFYSLERGGFLGSLHFRSMEPGLVLDFIVRAKHYIIVEYSTVHIYAQDKAMVSAATPACRRRRRRRDDEQLSKLHLLFCWWITSSCLHFYACESKTPVVGIGA